MAILVGDPRNWSGTRDPRDVKDYSYPRDKDFRPGEEDHERLVAAVLSRAHASRNAMQGRYPEWQRIDRTLRAFVRPEVYYKIEDSNSGRDTTLIDYGFAETKTGAPLLVMPLSYANMETLLTYMSAAFLQDPILRYEGQGPEDMVAAALLQSRIAKESVDNTWGLPLHTQWRDSFAYGVGPMSVSWFERYGWRTRLEEQYFLPSLFGQNLSLGKVRRKRKWECLEEGNLLQNVDPYTYFPDPAVPAHEVQKGEFWGWLQTTSYSNLLEMEEDIPNFLFNVTHLDPENGASSQFSYTKSDKQRASGIPYEYTEYSKRVDVVWMYIRIVPNDWGLGRNKRPEKWLFGVAGDKFLICAQPLRLDHDLFPGVCAAPDYDGYSAAPASRMGIINDMQQLVDFLYTAHVQNLRKAINNQWVIDPYMVNINDVNSSEPGKVIRLRRAAWGQGKVLDYVAQLPVTDVTANHIADIGFLQEIMSQSSGTNPSIAGVMQPRTTRVSASEAQGLRESNLSRLEHSARLIAMQSMTPLARMVASNTVQLSRQETWVKLTGEQEKTMLRNLGVEVNQDRVYVKPEQLVANYDLIPSTGAIPGAEDVGAWTELLNVFAANPLMMQHLDLPKIFVHLATALGAKNADAFVKAPQVMPDEQVLQEEQAGNLVPVQAPPIGQNGTAAPTYN